MFQVTKLTWPKVQKDASAQELSLTTWSRQSLVACMCRCTPPPRSWSIIHASSNSGPCVWSGCSHRATTAKLEQIKCSRTGKYWHLQGNQSKITWFSGPKRSTKNICCLLGHLWPSWTSSGQMIKAFRPNWWSAQWWLGQTINLHSQERFTRAQTPWCSRARGAGSPDCSRGSSAWSMCDSLKDPKFLIKRR